MILYYLTRKKDDILSEESKSILHVELLPPSRRHSIVAGYDQNPRWLKCASRDRNSTFQHR